jgi:L-aminopeptidase/D-esterase-like protein
VEKRRTDRAKRLKDKFGIPDRVSAEVILANEGKIHDAQRTAVAQTEQEFNQAEGNIAEQLAKAAESGNDGDIITAMATASQYHKTSDPVAMQRISQRRDHALEAVFAA